MEVIIRDRRYEITAEKVREALKDVEPQPISKYFIEVNHKQFPIKQVLAKTLNISPMEFGTMRAYQILQRLGFEIQEKTKEKT